jgi:uncharacterized repeat protein (TIGR03803 family)
MRNLRDYYRRILRAAVPIAGLASGSSAWAVTQEQVLYNFCSNRGNPVCSDGAGPTASLVMELNGNLYGTTANGGAQGSGVAFGLFEPANPAGTWAFSVLHNFPSNPNDGASPVAALIGAVVNGTGELYGTTYAGGTGHTGTVFELIPSSGGGFDETKQSLLGGDGANPSARLAENQLEDYVYGTTLNGGLYTKGTVFKVAKKTNNLLPVHQFGGVLKGRRDGANPFAGLVLDGKGNFFGTTNVGGGLANAPGVGYGVVYEIMANGDYKVIHEFGGFDSKGVNDGANPQADLAVDFDGNLYGTTLNGGKYNHGTVFKLARPASPTGQWIVTVLHSFEASWDGAGPIAGVILDRAGNPYGTASGGNGGSGVVFKISPPPCNHPTPPDPWCEDILWAFPGRANDGLYPHASLNYDQYGNLYGTTFGGGRWGQGVVFELTGTGFVPP